LETKKGVKVNLLVSKEKIIVKPIEEIKDEII
jgi:hypothetical protein